jgi:hypothetical protein
VHLNRGNTVKKLLLATLLVASMSVVTTKTVLAYYCDPAEFTTYTSWAGQCAPGGQDACGWFRDWCWIDCYGDHYGGFCDAFGWGCQEVNSGDESSPNWCITEGVCQCSYDY